MQELEIGDFIKSQYGHEGSIVGIYKSFWEIPSKDSKERKMSWLASQSNTISEEQLETSWCKIQVVTGGQAIQPVDTVELLMRIDIDSLIDAI
jgi:hypothetical protein